MVRVVGVAMVVRFAKVVRVARIGPWLGWRGCSYGGQGGRSYISVLYLVTYTVIFLLRFIISPCPQFWAYFYLLTFKIASRFVK